MEASFTESNIEAVWQATGIWPYDPEKTLAICAKNLQVHLRKSCMYDLHQRHPCHAMQFGN